MLRLVGRELVLSRARHARTRTPPMACGNGGRGGAGVHRFPFPASSTRRCSACAVDVCLVVWHLVGMGNDGGGELGMSAALVLTADDVLTCELGALAVGDEFIGYVGDVRTATVIQSDFRFTYDPDLRVRYSYNDSGEGFLGRASRRVVPVNMTAARLALGGVS